MSVQNAYKNYFDIDENYYASVSEELIAGGFVDWNSFYPHSTFVRLLQDTANILRREQKRSIWVEGAYGTGKSHAVLTLKKILDAPKEEVLKYFTNNDLDMDLFNKIQGAKKQGEILTIHRLGSATIKGDNALVMAIQESIKRAIVEKGLEFKCEDSLKDSIIKWLSDNTNATNFKNWIDARYKIEFGADDAVSIVHKLQTYKENEVADLTRKIFMVAEKEGITVLKLEARDLGKWIKDIIEKNKLKSIIFIWDEFTEYFTNNKNSITGFQTLAELSQTIPFHFIIVTHKSSALFNDKDDSKKIIDRFINPTCEINLPENMALKLIGKAIKIKNDLAVRDDWKKISEDLYTHIPICSSVVIKSSKIEEADLKKILPIHPYTAIILTHLSAMFGSNQRSMFEFIKNRKEDDNDRGFGWYIENHGPYSDENLLTIDMLWEYFYADGRSNLEAGLKSLLSFYDMGGNSKLLTADKKRVLKTVLLLQGISEKNLESVELFKPTVKNLCNAYEGTDLSDGKAVQKAEALVIDGLLFKRTIGNNEVQFVAFRPPDAVDVIKYIEEFRKDKKTKNIIEEYKVADFMPFTGALKLRYDVKTATIDDITRIVNGINNQQYENTLPVVITFAKNDNERAILIAKVRELSVSVEQRIIFVDTSLCDLSDEEFEEFIKSLSEEKYWRGKDNNLADQYKTNATDVITKWINKLQNAEFRIVTKNNEIKAFNEIKAYSTDEVINILKKYNQEIFHMGIENFNVIVTMFNATNFKLGARCGITQELSGQYRSANEATKLENALRGVWKIYKGTNPDVNHLVYRIKIKLDDLISTAFKKKGKISIAEIFNFLKAEPFGFMPCNLTAFIIGFLLKDYTNDIYRWSNEQVGDTLSVEKLVEMIDEIIKQQLNPNNRYVDKYIVKMTMEEIEFLHKTSIIFGINEENCATIEKTREEVRAAIKKISLPLWAINIALEKDRPIDWEVIVKLIELYCSLANNSGSGKTDTDIATEIGIIYLQHPGVVENFKKFINFEYCKKGMNIYLNEYKYGELKKLANEINCEDIMLAHLKSKITVDSSWLWQHDTINAKIDDLIIEYKIVQISNRFTPRTNSYKDTLLAWADKMSYFKLPYEGVKNDVDSLKDLFNCLYNIFTTNTIGDADRVIFLEALQINGEEFINKFNNQASWFKEKYSFDLDGLSEIDVSNIFTTMPLGSFAKTNSEFQNIANQKITEYRKTILIEELKELWFSKTSTKSPKDWSEEYKTPILCLVDESEYDIAKKSFETIMQKMSTDIEIKNAIEYFKRASIFDKMRNAEIRNNAFAEKVIGKNSIIKDIDETREVLQKRLTCSIYDWYPKTLQIENILGKYAEKLYHATGCEEALAKIESMSEANVKLYLKKLIRESIDVGMEILKDR